MTKYLNDPISYLKTLDNEEKIVYYMGYEHGKQASERSKMKQVEEALVIYLDKFK